MNSEEMLSCATAYRGEAGASLAADRCCRLRAEQVNRSSLDSQPATAVAVSSCRGLDFKDNPNLQCKEGFGGPLCRGCRIATHVKSGNGCKECDGGSSFVNALFAVCGVCISVYLLQLGFLLLCSKRISVNDDEKMKKSNKILGQVKIVSLEVRCLYFFGCFQLILLTFLLPSRHTSQLITFCQMLSSMPVAFNLWEWPAGFTLFSANLYLINLDFLRILTGSSCSLSVPPLQQFVLHMIFFPLLLLAVLLAYTTALVCPMGKTQSEFVEEAQAKR